MNSFLDLCVHRDSVVNLLGQLTQKKGAGVSARTLEESSLNEPSANLGRLLAAAALGHGSEARQRQQRPARLRHGTDVTHGDGGVWHGLNVSGVKREGFR